ncbi:purine nucleoside phosphorylase DeoD-type [Spirochaetia bacterium]|nr:purine nucleoside phosphorylase DeoD-type [Spirochaetia bacterium]
MSSIPTPHNRALEGEIAESILLPGDPMRAKYIAETFFENPVCFNDVRGMLGFTGQYKGKRVSVMGTGMGMPSLSIYVTELVKFYGVKNLIRVGTAGSCQEKVKIRDLLIAQGACTDNGFLRKAFSGDYAPIADFELLNRAYEKAVERKIPHHVGLIRSSDMFYHEPCVGEENWAKYGVLGVEMESALLYTIAAKYRARALALTVVSDSPFVTEILSSEEREQSLGEMIRLALDTIIEF